MEICEVIPRIKYRCAYEKDYRRLVEYMIGLKDMYDMIFGNL